jgi:hypothetical protein
MLNPITYSEKIVSDFLRYQLTTYPFADARLYGQMRALLAAVGCGPPTRPRGSFRWLPSPSVL